MSLAFNGLLDRWKHRVLSFTGTTDLRDHLLRGTDFYQDYELTATQLDTANETPVTILAAPGSGLVNVVTGILTFVDAGATPFELGSGTLAFKYTNGSGAEVATAVPNATLENSTDTYYWSVPAAVVPVPNAVIVAQPGADVTAGDGSVFGRIFYRTVKYGELA